MCCCRRPGLDEGPDLKQTKYIKFSHERNLRRAVLLGNRGHRVRRCSAVKAQITLPGLHIQALRGVHVGGQYRYVPDRPSDRKGEGCTVLQLARESPKGPADALVEFADGHRQVVPWASLRGLKEKYPLAPLELGA